VVSGPPPDVQTTSITFDQIRNSLENSSQQILDMLHRLRNWAAAPRDMNCLSAATGNTAAVGLTGGAALGLLGGPGAVVSVPTASGIGLLGGAGVGWVGGMINCKTGGASGGGGGGGGQSTGRTTPANLKEKLAMEQAQSNPGAGTEVPLKKGMTDPTWPGSQGWVKMRQNVNGVEIHYVLNKITGAVADFKFK
jgi:hypothetical protein